MCRDRGRCGARHPDLLALRDGRAAEIGGPHPIVLSQLRGRAGRRDGTIFHQIGVVGQAERHESVLFHDQNRQPFGLQASQSLGDQVDHEGREAERRLVEQKDPGLRHERAADRDHLLFTARHRSGRLRQTLAKPRKELQHIVARARDLGGRLQVGSETQVVLDRHRPEHVPAFRHEHEPGPDQTRRGRSAPSRSEDGDPAGARPHHARDHVQSGGLAGSVRADQRNHLAGRDGQAHVPEHVRAAIAGPHVAHLEDGAHRASSFGRAPR